MRHAVVCLVLPIVLSGCENRSAGPSSKPEPPAKVEAPVKEADLTKVHLTEEAAHRLGISLTAVESKRISLARTLGGTITAPQGGTLRISAPFGGTILTTDAEFPRPGMSVAKGRRLLRIVPVFIGEQEVLSSPERLSLAKAKADLAAGLAEAEGQVAASEAQLQAARAQLDRADKLRREGAGSQQNYEEATAATRKAEADLRAARSRLEVLSGIRLDMQPAAAPAWDVEAPFAAIVSELHVRAGLEVAAGTPLVDLTVLDPIWVRVPVYVGDLDAIAPADGTTICGIGDEATAGVEVRQVEAAPAGDPNAATVDLFFEVPNPQRRWSPAQKVLVRIPLKQAGEAPVIPWSAVVHDVHGGTWVYVSNGEQTYARQRVEVREVADGLAVLAKGPPPGTPVVTSGAAELFGTEFGSGK